MKKILVFIVLTLNSLSLFSQFEKCPGVKIDLDNSKIVIPYSNEKIVIEFYYQDYYSKEDKLIISVNYNSWEAVKKDFPLNRKKGFLTINFDWQSMSRKKNYKGFVKSIEKNTYIYFNDEVSYKARKVNIREVKTARFLQFPKDKRKILTIGVFLSKK